MYSVNGSVAGLVPRFNGILRIDYKQYNGRTMIAFVQNGLAHFLQSMSLGLALEGGCHRC